MRSIRMVRTFMLIGRGGVAMLVRVLTRLKCFLLGMETKGMGNCS